MVDNYYTSRKSKLLKEFDKSAKRVRGVFVARYSEELASEMLKDARQEYAALIPQLPYIGGKQPFTQFIISSGWFLAMYRALKRHGETVEQIGKLTYEASEVFLEAYPAFLRRFLGHMTFSRRYLRKLRKRATESQKRQYAGDYVYTCIEGDGKEFDFGVDYLECGTCKFLDAQGASELAPYLCLADILYSEALGWGLARTRTLAEGRDRCDFRFKQGGETRIAVPQGFEEVFKKSKA